MRMPGLCFWLLATMFLLPVGSRALGDTPQTGATLTVTTTADHDDGVCGTGDCTLREAINAANATPGAGAINFAASVTGAITLLTGELVVTDTLRIDGPGARILSVDGNLNGRVFRIEAPGAVVGISELTITRGQNITNGAVSQGGGIYSTANLTLTNCTVSNNSALGSFVSGTSYGAIGGGICNAGVLTMTGCTVAGNLAQGGTPPFKGGSANGGDAYGGGLYMAAGTASITLQNCTITGNIAAGGTGGQNLFGGKGGDGGRGEGGGIGVLSSDKVTMVNTTLNANTARAGGGGSGSPSGSPGLALAGGFFCEGTAMVTNSIIAGNICATGSDIAGPAGDFKSGGHNLVGNADNGCCFNGPGDKTGSTAMPIDAKTGVLANNGGPTDTIELLSGSPAIDAGDDSFAPSKDQRGASRVGVSDIGAFEFGGVFPTPTPTATPTGTPAASPTPGLVGNVSTRLSVGTGDDVLIEGFIVQGPAGSNKKIIVRAIGPSLAPFGIVDALTNPSLEIHDSTGAAVATNDDWRNTQVGGLITGDQSAAIGASQLAPSNDLESAIIADLAPGSYTAVVRGVNNTTGTGVVDVYDLSAASPAKLANIATRGQVQPGDKLMIAGFIVQNGPVRTVVRAIGPSLAAFGINNALPDTTLQLRDQNGAIVVEDDDWKIRSDGSSQQAELEATSLQPSDDREAAFVTMLQPGQYTAQVRGKPEATGIGVVQVYFLQ